MIITFVVMSILAAAFYTARQPKIYRAKASMLVTPPSGQNIGNIRLGQLSYAEMHNYVNNQQRILQSGLFGEKLLAQLPAELAQDLFGCKPKQISPQVVLGAFSVVQEKDNNVLEVSCSSRTATACSRMANLVVDVFIQESKESIGSSEALLVWMKREIPKVEKKMMEKQEVLLKFEESNPEMLFLSQEQDGGSTKLIERLKSELQETKIELLNKEVQYQKCRQARKTGKIEQLLSLIPMNERSLITTLKGQLAEKQNQLTELRLRYQDRHPDIKRLMESIKQLQEMIREEALSEIRRQEFIYLNLQEKQTHLQKMLQEQQARSLSLKKKFLQYNRQRAEYKSLQNTYTNFIDKMKELDIMATYLRGNVRRLDTAFTPKSPYRPNRSKNYMLGALLGLLAGIGLAFLLEMLDARAKSVEEIEHLLPYPVHGLVPFISGKMYQHRASQAVIDKEHSPVAEAFRAMTIPLFTGKANQRCLVVTSPMASDGKTTMLCNLALTAARTGRKTLIIDGDLRKPQLHSQFQLPRERGFSELLQQQLPLAECRHQVQPNLWCVCAGKAVNDPYECLHNSNLSELLQQLQQDYHYVLIDCPPLEVVADSLLFKSELTTYLLVISIRQAHKKLLQRMGQRLETLDIPVQGIIVNDSHGDILKDHRYGYYYHSYYRYSEKHG